MFTHTRSTSAGPERDLNSPRPLLALLNLACLLAVLLSLAAMSWASAAPNSKFDIFKKFVNGEIPIKEAVVHRMLRRGGKLLNEDRWRFSLQDGGTSWYLLDLGRYNINHNTVGASAAQLWVVGDKSLGVADKTCARGSGPYVHWFERDLLWSAVTLGLPSDWGPVRNAPLRSVRWEGNRFEALETVPVGRGKSIRPTTRVVHGEVKLKDGRPSEAVYDSGRTIVTYDYRGGSAIPKGWISISSGRTVQCEFERLELGANALCGGKGFLPGSFAKSSSLHCYVWTNDVSYEVTDNGLWRTSDIVRARPHRTGLVAMIAIVAATFSCLFLYYCVIQKKRKLKQRK